jgi:NADH-quinone oxidoreductase subunit M
LAPRTLWMIKRVVFGDVANSHVAALADVGAREFWMLMILAVAVLIVGVWPAPIVDRMDASIGQLLMHVGQPKL